MTLMFRYSTKPMERKMEPIETLRGSVHLQVSRLTLLAPPPIVGPDDYGGCSSHYNYAWYTIKDPSGDSTTYKHLRLVWEKIIQVFWSRRHVKWTPLTLWVTPLNKRPRYVLKKAQSKCHEQLRLGKLTSQYRWCKGKTRIQSILWASASTLSRGMG